jgi:hypothetical protein
MPKKTGFAMSATIMPSIPVPRSETTSLHADRPVAKLLRHAAHVFGGL